MKSRPVCSDHTHTHTHTHLHTHIKWFHYYYFIWRRVVSFYCAWHFLLLCTETFRVTNLLPYQYFHLHLSLNCQGLWGNTDDFTKNFLHFFLSSTAIWDLVNSRPVHSLMLSSHLFFCLPYLLPPFTVPCKMVLARPDKWETCPYHFSLHVFIVVRRSSCGPIARWILAWTPSLLTWSLYEMHSILRFFSHRIHTFGASTSTGWSESHCTLFLDGLPLM